MVTKNIDLRFIHPVHCKMARAALGMGVRELAAMVGVSPNTISRFERNEDMLDKTIYMIRNSLEKQGIEFLYENGSGPGVRLRKD